MTCRLDIYGADIDTGVGAGLDLDFEKAQPSAALISGSSEHRTKRKARRSQPKSTRALLLGASLIINILVASSYNYHSYSK